MLHSKYSCDTLLPGLNPPIKRIHCRTSGPVHTGRGAPCNMRTQIMEHTAVNGSVHTGCKQHERVCVQICTQICLCVLCERGLRFSNVHFLGGYSPRQLVFEKLSLLFFSHCHLGNMKNCLFRSNVSGSCFGQTVNSGICVNRVLRSV